MAASDLTKKYYKIKDAAELIGVSQTTLRFWESEFPEVQPYRSPKNLSLIGISEATRPY